MQSAKQKSAKDKPKTKKISIKTSPKTRNTQVFTKTQLHTKTSPNLRENCKDGKTGICTAKRVVHIIQTLCRVPPKRGFFRGDFLFVLRKCHAPVRSVFFISNHGVRRLFTYKVLVVISGQIGFTLKIALKC